MVCWLCLYHDDDDESGDYGKAPIWLVVEQKNKVRDKKSREIKKENISGISTFFKTQLSGIELKLSVRMMRKIYFLNVTLKGRSSLTLKQMVESRWQEGYQASMFYFLTISNTLLANYFSIQAGRQD